jgi:hypothetical protein
MINNLKKLTTQPQEQLDHTFFPEVEADTPREVLQLTIDERTGMDVSDVHEETSRMETGTSQA